MAFSFITHSSPGLLLLLLLAGLTMNGFISSLCNRPSHLNINFTFY